MGANHLMLAARRGAVEDGDRSSFAAGAVHFPFERAAAQTVRPTQMKRSHAARKNRFALERHGSGRYLAAMPVRVALSGCADYASVASALDALMQPLGGWASFIRPGQSVLVKPNLLTARKPDEAVTTHPALARAVLRSLRALGAKPFVADSPASVADLNAVWERTGFLDLCREEDVPLVNVEKAGSMPCESAGMRFSVGRPFLAADVIVNLPKVKTHVLTGLTAGVKNMYGAVPGYQKTSLHKQYAGAVSFGRLLAAVYARVKPVVTIADGIVGMEGNGPSAGRPVKLGFLAASTDAVALDVVLCRLVGLDSRRVPYLRAAAELGAGEVRLEQIEVVGASIESCSPASFRPPMQFFSGAVPEGALRLLGRLIWTRPRFTAQCARCGQCVRACPAGALALGANDARPRLNFNACIECCCCHEVCPARAVEMRASPLMRVATAARRMARPKGVNRDAGGGR